MEIEEIQEKTEKEVKERKAIFRAIEVISAYNNGYIIDK